MRARVGVTARSCPNHPRAHVLVSAESEGAAKRQIYLERIARTSRTGQRNCTRQLRWSPKRRRGSCERAAEACIASRGLGRVAVLSGQPCSAAGFWSGPGSQGHRKPAGSLVDSKACAPRSMWLTTRRCVGLDVAIRTAPASARGGTGILRGSRTRFARTEYIVQGSRPRSAGRLSDACPRKARARTSPAAPPRRRRAAARRTRLSDRGQHRRGHPRGQRHSRSRPRRTVRVPSWGRGSGGIRSAKSRKESAGHDRAVLRGS